MLRANWKFMKYVIFTLHSLNNKPVNKNPIRPTIKVKPHQKLDTDEGESAKDEGESTTSTELSDDSISDTPTEATEDSKPIETPQVPTDFNKSRCDQHPSEDKPICEYDLPIENGEQNTVKDNKLLTTIFTVEIQNQKVEGLITYSLHQQIFKFKVNKC